MGSLSNIKIGGSNTRKIIIVCVLLAVCYYYFYYSKGKELTSYDIQTFIGNTIFFVALQNTPFILL
jgi:hypothetical protein